MTHYHVSVEVLDAKVRHTEQSLSVYLCAIPRVGEYLFIQTDAGGLRVDRWFRVKKVMFQYELWNRSHICTVGLFVVSAKSPRPKSERPENIGL